MKRLIAFAALACALAAAPAVAQDTAPVQPAGSTAVSVDVGGGYVVGLWRQTSPRVRAGIEVGTQLERRDGDDDAEQDYSAYVVRPSVKLFSGGEGAVRPYTLVGLYVEGFRNRARDPADAESVSRATEVGGRVGVGLEWMPMRRVAIGGHVGVSGGYVSERYEFAGGDERKSDGWSASTFASGIALTLFF